jgi:hypothetical protein
MPAAACGRNSARRPSDRKSKGVGRTGKPIAGAIAAAAAVLALAPAAAANRSQESVFMDDAELVYGTDPEVQATMGILRSIGADRVRVSVFWRLVAPRPDDTARPSFDATDPSAYPPGAWDRFDRIVLAARRYGLSLHFTITGPGPIWASSDPSRGDRAWEPSPVDFRAFVTAVGRRYSGSWDDEQPQPTPEPGGPPILPPPPPPDPGPAVTLPRVSFWSAWNEPNQPGWLRPQTAGGVPASPRLYRKLQDAAWAGLRASGHGRDTYVLAETAPRGSSRTRAVSPMRPLLFIRELYCLDRRLRPYRGSRAAVRDCPTDAAGRRRFVADHPGLFQATGWAHHPYALEVAPRVRDRHPEQVTISTLSRLTRTLDRVFRRYRVRRRLPIWLTEYGYQTNPPDPVVGVSWNRQAAYLNQAEAIAYRNRRVRSLTQFLLVDDGPNRRHAPSDVRYWGSTFQSGLVTTGGRRKPAFTAWQRTIDVSQARARRGRRLRVIGQLRPAAPRARLRAFLEFRRKGSRRWRRVRTLRTRSLRNFVSARVRARASGHWRLSWPTRAGTVRSRSASVRVVRARSASR